MLTALGISGDEARVSGLLLKSTADGNLWPALQPADLVNVDFSAMATQIPALLMLVALIVVVVNVGGLEIAANQDLDWDREFRATGSASVVAGLGGGTAANLIVPASLRSKLFGASTRLTGVVAALVIAAGLWLGDGLPDMVALPLVGGILFFAGLGMLDRGLVTSRKRLPWSEYGIIVLIFGVIITFGLFEGVAAGMLATLVFFAVRLSRVDPIDWRSTTRPRASAGAPRRAPNRTAPSCWTKAKAGRPTGWVATFSSAASALWPTIFGSP